MSHDPKNDDALLQEELVAYLDGELDADQTRQLEQRVAVQPDARRMLEEFDRTWHLLDELETPTANDDFTRTTLEMVALAAKADAAKMKAEAPRRLWWARLWTAAGLIAAAALGFLLVAAFATDPNAQLLQDLQLLENYNQYHDIDSIEFLYALSKENLFSRDADGAAPPASFHAAETISQARRRFRAMPANQQEELLRNDQEIKPDERKHIRELHEAIQIDPDRDKLVAVMNRYSKWFDELPPWQRGELKKKDVPDRIKEIKDLLAISDWVRLDPKDRQVVAKWMHDYIAAHAHDARFAPGMPPGSRGREGGPPPPPHEGPGAAPKPPLGGFYGGLRRGDPRSWLSPDVMSELKSRLSHETRDHLEARTTEEQRQIIARWLFENASAVGDEGLADYFEKLPPQQRDHWMSLPGEDMYNDLFLMVVHDQPWRGDWTGPRGSGGRRRGNPPGTWDTRSDREPEAAKDTAQPASTATKPSQKS